MGNCILNHKKGEKSSSAALHGGSGGTKVSDENSHPSALPRLKVPENHQKSTGKSPPTPRSEGDILSSPHLKAFTLGELKHATRNFRTDCLIGEGGFGYVYKGWIDEHNIGAPRPGCGMVVAIKKLKPGGLQGHKEWLSEVNYLGQLHHPHLVKLFGYCVDGENRLLVYEYMPKGSLENHLFRRGARPLPWATRIKVATAAARGLTFLHDSEQQIIYRDFKTSNILLDADFNAKLSDFGLAKAGPTGENTHVSTQVMGTQGYAAPEYIATGRLTARCDVYSFGVVLLELLTGRRVVDKTKSGLEQSLVDWAKPYLGDKRKLYRIMDTKLEGQYPHREAYMVALLASQCISDAKLRPPMTEVLSVLENLQAARRVNPAFSDQQSVSSPRSKSPSRSRDSTPPNMTPRESQQQKHGDGG